MADISKNIGIYHFQELNINNSCWCTSIKLAYRAELLMKSNAVFFVGPRERQVIHFCLSSKRSKFIFSILLLIVTKIYIVFFPGPTIMKLKYQKNTLSWKLPVDNLKSLFLASWASSDFRVMNKKLSKVVGILDHDPKNQLLKSHAFD